MNLFNLSIESAGLGILSHLAYFIRGEHHKKAPVLFRSFCLAPFLIVFVQLGFAPWSIWEDLRITGFITVSYALGLLVSISAYRIFFHRLRHFPGPFLAKVSKLYHVASIVNLDNFKKLDKMQKYGEFVRTGPSEITIFVPEAIPALYGSTSKCTKAPRYDVSWPTVSLHSTRDKTLHDKRRRIWDRAFNTKSLRNYENRVLSYVDELIQQISAYSGRPVSANRWFNFYSFDLMGALAFGKSFEMLKEGKQHYILDKLFKAQRPLGFLSPAPWLFMILAKLPGLGTDFRTFIQWCGQQVENRKTMTVDEPDIMSYLLEASDKDEFSGQEQNWLMGDSRLIVIAGSDTTAATLTHIFYHLARDQTQISKLRDELEKLDVSTMNFTCESVRTADHLNGTINEALRMHHAIPGGTLRVTPPDGLLVAETYIPGNTTVIVPFFSIGRSEKAYERPGEFIPERWYSQPELVRNKDAFAPFLQGPYSCVGKQLALMSLRAVISLMVLTFDVRFAPGENGDALIHESKDLFTISMADLKIVFTKRK